MSRVAELLLAQGRTQADLARQRGQIWGEAIQNISQIPGQILTAHRQQQRLDAQTALELARELRLRGQEDRARQLDQLAQQDIAAKRKIAGAAWETGTFNPDAAIAAANEVNRPDLIAEIHETAQKLKPPPVFHPAGSVGVDPLTGHPVEGATIPEKVTYGAPTPMMIGGTRQLVRTGSNNKLYDMQGHEVSADVAPDEPPMTPYQKAELGLQGQRLTLEKQKAAQAQADVTELTPEGLDAAAMMFAKTGQLPALGMGDKTTRKKIINRAAQLTPGLDVASAKADYHANTASLTQLEKQRAAIGAFEQTASKNIDVFLETAGKVVDTGSPLANTLFRQASGKLLGSPDQARYDAARQVAVNEIAKITSNPTLAGTLSDSARHEVEAFNPANATLAQTVAVMRLLKRDMQNRTDALDDQIRAIRGRIKQGAPDSSAPAGADPLGLFGPKKP